MGAFGEFCPNCGEKEVEKIDTNTIHCPACDETFVRSKKKVTPDRTSVISQLKDAVKKNTEEITDINKKLEKDKEFV